MTKLLRTAIPMLVFLVFIGCQQVGDPIEIASEVAGVQDEATKLNSSHQQESTLNLKLPYPDRVNPFLATNIEADSVGVSSIRLCGFVDVEAPAAVFLSDGKAMVVRSGGNLHGIQVVAIDPPAVKLAENGREWTEKMAAPMMSRSSVD